MDKVQGLLAIIVFGSPLIIMTLAICWAMDDERTDKRQSDDDSDIRYYIPSWCWRRRNDNGHDISGEKGEEE